MRIQYVYTLLHARHQKSSFPPLPCIWPPSPILPSPQASSAGSHHSVVYPWEFAFALFCYFVQHSFCFIVYIWMTSCGFVLLFIWFISLGTVPSRPIGITNDSLSSCLWRVILRVHVCHIFFLHSASPRQSPCFHDLAIVNRLQWNRHCKRRPQASFWIGVFLFFRWTPRRGLAGLHCSSILSFLRTLHAAFHTGCTKLQSTDSAWWFPFAHILYSTC